MKGKKIGILGCSKEGKATIAYLRSMDQECFIVVFDGGECTKEMQRYLEEQGIHEFYFGSDYLSYLNRVDIVVKTPGIPGSLPAIQDAKKKGVLFTSSTNIFLTQKKGKVITVTGSKGKSTTSSLLYQMLLGQGFDVKLIGNIGYPMITFLEDDHKDRLYVAEMSSYQLEDLTVAPDYFLMVSFFPDHLDYHGGLDAYFSAKTHIVEQICNQDHIFYNASFPRMRAYFEHTTPHAHGYGQIQTSTVDDQQIIVGDIHLSREHIALKGDHNAMNILGACTVASVFGVKQSVMEKVIRDFVPLPHRLQDVGVYQDIRCIDDAISTTPESTIAALQTYTDSIGCIILGGKNRGYDFKELAQHVIQRAIPLVILFPDSGAEIFNALSVVSEEEESVLPQCISVDSMGECVRVVMEYCPKHTICLLSCASPSYSIFKNFEEKGDLFQKYLKEYSK